MQYRGNSDRPNEGGFYRDHRCTFGNISDLQVQVQVQSQSQHR